MLLKYMLSEKKILLFILRVLNKNVLTPIPLECCNTYSSYYFVPSNYFLIQNDILYFTKLCRHTTLYIDILNVVKIEKSLKTVDI